MLLDLLLDSFLIKTHQTSLYKFAISVEFWAKFQTVVSSGRKFPETKIHLLFKADVEKDGSVRAGISRREVQHNDKTKPYHHDEAAAFEHAQNHQPREPRIQEKTVIHHDDESGQENERHGGDGIENESHSEKDGEIDVELSDRHERDDGAEKESYSGDENRVEDDHILKSELRGEKTLKERNEIDHEDEDGEQEFSGEDNDLEEVHVQDKKGRKFNSDHSVDDEDVRNEWKHFQMHTHQKNDDEFGYITNEEEDDYSEDNDNESISGERDYDHVLMKTMHVHRKEHPPDTHVMGKIAGEEDEEDEDEHSGEGDDFNIIYDRRKWKPTEQNNESEYHEQSFFEDVEDVMSLSGAQQRSKRDEDNIPEDDGDTVWQTESARIKSAGPTKRKIPENNKEEPDRQRKNTRNKRNILKKDIITKKRMIKEVESEKRTKSDVNNVEDFYLDENDKPKARMFSVEMQDVKKDSDYGENINSGHQKINKRAQTENSKAEGGNEYRRGNSRHLLQIMNTTGPAKTLPGQWQIWNNLISLFSEVI